MSSEVTFILQGSQQEKREKRRENLSEEITDENFPKLEKESVFQVQGAQRALHKMN